jgi:hypothetical protein
MVTKPVVELAHTTDKFGGYERGIRWPRMVVHHTTATTEPGDHPSLGCMTSPANPDTHCGTASCNYLIARSGTIYEVVDPHGGAPWTNGRVLRPDLTNPIIAQVVKDGVNPNQWSLTIEHECLAGHEGELTVAQWRSSAQLVAWLCQEFHLTPDRTHLVGHYQVDGVNKVNCPGWSDEQWATHVARVQAIVAAGPVDPVSQALVNWYRAIRPVELQGDLSPSVHYEADVNFSAIFAHVQGWQRAIVGEYVGAWFDADGTIWPIHWSVLAALNATKMVRRRG